MVARNLSILIAGLLTMGAFGTLVGGCTYDEAKYYCTHGDPNHPGEGGFSGPGLDGCIVGAHEVGPAHDNTADSDKDCEHRFDVKSVRFDGNPNWMEQTSSMIDRRNGCHYGAIGHMRGVLIMNGDAGGGEGMGTGCLEKVDAGGNISCNPDPGPAQ